MSFEQYKTRRGRKITINNVILQAGTYLRFNKNVMERLGLRIGQYFNIMYDKENMKIALIPVDKDGGYKLSSAGNIWVRGLIREMGVKKGRYCLKDSVSTDGVITLEFT